MADDEKRVPKNDDDDLSFEDIFSDLRKKYNLTPFSDDEENGKVQDTENKVFYNPSEDTEINDFFKEKEDNFEDLFDEVDANISTVDDKSLKDEEETFNLNFNEKKANNNSEDLSSENNYDSEYEDISSSSEEAPEIEPVDDVPITQNDKRAFVAEDEYYETDEEDYSPKKKNGVGEIIRKIVLVISILAIIGSCAWIANDYILQPYLNKKMNQEISDLVSDESPEKAVEKLNNLTVEEKTKTFADLSSINKDFKCWLVIPGADVSLPVVQTSNNSKYLKTGFKGSYLAAGSLFIDSGNTSPFNDQNTIIYGHNMRDGSMFGSVSKYKSLSVFKKYPLIYIYSPQKNYVYKIVSVYLTNSLPSEDNGYVLAYTFKNISADSFSSYIDEIKKRSYYNTGVDVQSDDKILTLQTCDRTVIKNGRLIVVARAVREDESEDVAVSEASVNTKQKFPAIWYSKKKISNPFKNDKKWIAS